tara:strand:+ start:961 stop:1317 length:357 start_codon:yes stop_codon:yes gene_type:complete
MTDKWIQEFKDFNLSIQEEVAHEIWRGYAKFKVARGANITDILDKFRGIEGITVCSSVEVVATEEEEIHMVKFKFIKIGHWRQYFKYLRHVALFHPSRERRIEGLKSIQFVKKPEQIL